MNYKSFFFKPVYQAWLFLFSTLSLIGQTSGDSIYHREVFNFPAYEEAETIQELLSKGEYRLLVNSDYVMEKLTYKSDSLWVKAYVYRPANTSQSLPTIIYNRGGYLIEDDPIPFLKFFHRLAQKGFVVVAPLLRQSAGSPGKDEVGGADLDDIFNLLPAMASISFIDEKNLFMYGESRGGMMTFQAIRDKFPIRAAATFGAFTDFGLLIDSHKETYEPLVYHLWPDFTKHKEEIVRRRSVIQWPEKITVPLLLMHGKADESVNFNHTTRLVDSLKENSKPYEVIIFKNDNHVLSRNEEERDRRATEHFWKHYLKLKR